MFSSRNLPYAVYECGYNFDRGRYDVNANYFEDFLPRVPTARRPVSEAAQKMWQTLRVHCPECNRPLVPCLGDVGIALR